MTSMTKDQFKLIFLSRQGTNFYRLYVTASAVYLNFELEEFLVNK